MKTTGKNILLLLALLTAPMVAAEAQESVAMPFVDNALNPRSAAMGGISAGLSSDAYAQFGNIAAIPFSSDNLAAGVTYNSWQPTAAGINAGVAGAAYRLGRFGISFGASAAINQSYEGVSETGVSLGKFTPIDWQVGAGVSYLITDSFSAGIGLNYASSVTSAYYKGAIGAMLIYDITSSISFNGLHKWLRELRENSDDNIVIMLVGNKTDLAVSRSITEQEGQKYADKEHLLFMETSAVSTTNVQEAFTTLISTILNQYKSTSFGSRDDHRSIGRAHVAALQEEKPPLECCKT